MSVQDPVWLFPLLRQQLQGLEAKVLLTGDDRYLAISLALLLEIQTSSHGSQDAEPFTPAGTRAGVFR